MSQARHCTVTMCHSRTKNLNDFLKQADIIVSAVGIIDLIKTENVKEGVIVVDVAINRKKDGKLTGDVDFEEVSKKASAITPVPGGIGPMTIAMLVKNTFNVAKIKNDKK